MLYHLQKERHNIEAEIIKYQKLVLYWERENLDIWQRYQAILRQLINARQVVTRQIDAELGIVVI